MNNLFKIGGLATLATLKLLAGEKPSASDDVKVQATKLVTNATAPSQVRIMADPGHYSINPKHNSTDEDRICTLKVPLSDTKYQEARIYFDPSQNNNAIRRKEDEHGNNRLNKTFRLTEYDEKGKVVLELRAHREDDSIQVCEGKMCAAGFGKKSSISASDFREAFYTLMENYTGLCVKEGKAKAAGRADELSSAPR